MGIEEESECFLEGLVSNGLYGSDGTIKLSNK